MRLISTDTYNSRGTDCVCVNRSTEWRSWTQATVFTYTKPIPKVSVIYGVDNLHFARPKGKLADHLAGITARAWLMHLFDHSATTWLVGVLPHREFMVNVREDYGRGTYKAFIAYRDHTAHCTKFFKEVYGIGPGGDPDASIRLHTPPALATIDRVDWTKAPRG